MSEIEAEDEYEWEEWDGKSNFMHHMVTFLGTGQTRVTLACSFRWQERLLG